MFVLRKVGDSYSYGLDGEPRRHAEPYSYVLTRTFTRIRTAAARRHEPGNEKFLAAHNNMQTFVGFFEYAQSLDTTVKPNQCYKLIETFRYLLDEVLETSK
jgi:hypothetical protein